MSYQEETENQLLYSDEDVLIIEEAQNGPPRPNSIQRQNFDGPLLSVPTQRPSTPDRKKSNKNKPKKSKNSEKVPKLPKKSAENSKTSKSKKKATKMATKTDE